MNTQQKYDRIMEVMSDKTESLGCLIKHWDSIIVATWNVLKIDRRKYKIIWHPLHIWHVLDWMEVNKLSVVSNPTGCGCCHDETDNQWWVLELWKDKRLPLSPTDTELVDYIYSLISD